MIQYLPAGQFHTIQVYYYVKNGPKIKEKIENNRTMIEKKIEKFF